VTPNAPTEPPAPRVPAWGVAAAAAALAFLAFLPALRADFVNWDDEVNFTHNKHYRGLGPAQLRWMFTDTRGHYMPVTWLTLGLDYVLYGMKPAGYHLTSLLFHAANAFAFTFVLLRLLRRALPGTPEKAVRWAALAGALFFAVHPLRAESVAWVTERRDVVSGLFFMIAVWAYLKHHDGAGQGRRWWRVSLAAFALSLLSKATGMTLPLVLLALDAYPLRRFDAPRAVGPLLREKIPYFVLMVASIALTRVVQREAGALYPLAQYPWVDILFQPAYRLCFYVVKTAAPFALSPLYPYQSLSLGFEAKYLAALAAVLVGAGLLWALRRRRPALAAAAFAYAALISPVVVWQAGPHFAADRYTYLACLPFAALAGAGVAGRGRAVAAGAAAVLAGLFALGWRQARVWQDSFSLWDHAIAVGTPGSIPYVSRGTARGVRGDWDGAARDFERALEIYPKDKRALDNLSKLSLLKGDPAAAEKYASRAIALDPSMATAWHNRALARVERRQFGPAVEDFTRVLDLAPAQKEMPVDAVDVLCNRALARQKGGDPAGAEEDASKALALDPASVRALQIRGTARTLRRDADGSLADFRRARDLDPRLYAPHVARGMARADAGDLDGAIADYDEAIRRDPRDVAAYVNRGVARSARGDDAAALADHAEAIRIDPTRSVAWAKRGRAKAKLGDLAGAVADCTEAVRLDPRNAEALGVRGCARADRGDVRGAVEDFEEALRVARPDWSERKAFESFLDQARRLLPK
jgi:tetratricopeptide (TPR) repeat protein